MLLREYKSSIWFEVGFLFLATFVVYAHLTSLDLQLEWDEFYGILAARSWVENGSFSIADGTYDRGALFTMLLGSLFQNFGESIAIARLPSMLSGSLLVVAVFLWTRWVAGRPAAWIAALLFCFSPRALELSVYIRFYALHGLVFWLGACSVYAFLARQASPRMMFASAAAAIVIFGLAFHLQKTTVIGLIGLGLWVTLQLGFKWKSALLMNRGLNWYLASLLVLSLVTVILLIQTGVAAGFLDSYLYAAGWNASKKYEYGFYHTIFLEQYPTLWTLFPLAALIAIVRKQGPGLFCCCIFGTAIVLHSFAGMKALRYIHYIMPFFFVIWGIALAEIYPYVRRFILVFADRVLSKGLGLSLQTGLGRSIRRPLGWVGLFSLVFFLVVSNGAFPSVYRFLSGDEDYWLLLDLGWQAAGEEFRPQLDDVSVVLVTEPMHALYYLERYDFSVTKAGPSRIDSRDEFGLVLNTGRPAISTGESIELILTCYPDGLFVSTAAWFRTEISLFEETLGRLGLEPEIIQYVPRGVRSLRWKWQEPPSSTACSTLTQLQSDAKAWRTNLDFTGIAE